MISEDKFKRVNSTVYEFGEFRLETENLLLQRDSEIIPLAPKALEVLLALVESNGKLMTKQEIIDKVWANTFVEEANLTHHISALRKGLGEDKNGHKFIETIPRKGYRFVAEVKDAADYKSAEITITERALVQVIEEKDFEKTKESTEYITVSATPHLDLSAWNLTVKKSRLGWVFAAGLSVLLFSATVFFGWRYFGLLNKTATVSMPEVVFQRLTPDTDSYAPSVSPDGASIAFARVEKNQETLWRKSIASNQMTQLLPTAPSKDGKILSTRFSSDGRWIYYKKNVEAEGYRNIYRIPSGGGTPQKILSNVNTDFSISPDGRQIAFTRDFRQLIVTETETGVERILMENDGMKKVINSENNCSVAWSPDGTRLLYAGSVYQYFRNVPQFVEVEATTGAERVIPIDIPQQIPGSVGQLEYLPNGNEIIGTVGGEIWKVSLETGRIARISGQNDNFASIRLSADGKTLIGEQSFSYYNIWTAPADRLDQKRQLTTGANARRGVLGLKFVPNGKIIYASLEEPANNLWEIDADGGSPRQLTNNAGNNGSPQITRDGRFIVFKSTRSGTMQIWRMETDGRNPVQLSKGMENWIFNLSPENEVYYSTLLPDGRQYQLFRVSIEGGESVEVTDRYYAWSPNFSPDGKLMLTWGAKTKEDALRLTVIDRATGNSVLDIKQNIEMSRWSADSKSFYYVNQSNGQLFGLPINNGEPKQITDFYPLSIAAYDVSADEKNMVFSLGERTNEIVLVKNFSEQTK